MSREIYIGRAAPTVLSPINGERENMKTEPTPFGRTVAAAVFLMIGGLVLSGCASDATGAGEGAGEDAASESSLFSQELHDQLPDHIQEQGFISIGSGFDTPPMLGANPQDATQAVGIAPDLAEEISEILGVDFEWTNVAWPGQLPGLEAGTFDLLWGQISTQEEREREIIDQISMFRISMALLIPEGNPEGITGFEDVCGLKFGSPIGSTFTTVAQAISDELCVAAGAPPIDIAEYPNASTIATALLAGQVDTMMDTNTTIEAIEASNPDSFEVVPVDRSVTEPHYPGLVAIGISKANPGLSTAMAGALQILHDEGIYLDVLEEWDSADSAMERDELVVNLLTGTPAGEFAK